MRLLNLISSLMWSFFLACYISSIYAIEYTYPVAALNDGTTILYIHQHNSTQIELCSWNIHTQHSEPILWSIFNPTGVTLLPDQSGFSFMDNGRLRIQLFQRRSPKAIDFDEPLYNINTLHWINNDSCYCSAQYIDNFALFELHTNGTLQSLMYTKGKDCMYPQKIDNQLFYIERDKTNTIAHYQIMHSLYPTTVDAAQPSKAIINFDSAPIIFLNMISDQEGFVLQHTNSIGHKNQTLQFLYHHIIKKGNIWSKEQLFSFDIPTNLLVPGEQQLYESILPLLPRVINNKVYFVDCSQNKDYSLEPYFYDLIIKKIKKATMPAQNKHCFVPIACGKTLCYGGTHAPSTKSLLLLT